jgi:hypothetical protein
VVFCAFACLIGGRGLAQTVNPPTTVTVEVTKKRLPINPLIYGVTPAASATPAALGATSSRWGGDQASRYNWRLNAFSWASDYFFQTQAYPGVKAGAAADAFVAQARAGGQQTMVTIPMIGWVASLGAKRSPLGSYSILKYGPQCATDPVVPIAGDGVATGCSTVITGNDPNDANVPDTIANERDWVRHLVVTWGGAARGGVGYYILDNEMSDWWETHRDVRPAGLHATDTLALQLQFAAMIHGVDPAAKVVAPEEWGWWALRYSGYDQQQFAQNPAGGFPDWSGVQNYLYMAPWLMSKWKAAGHPVDVFSIHYYPSSGEHSDDVSVPMQLLRNRSTRELWDASYVSESYIDEPVALIPQLKTWLSTNYYSSTPVAITEYSWGADGSINGATAEADILGIFGRQGLGMANRFQAPDPSTPTYKAMQMYRNYDGAGSTFGDVSVSTTTPNADNLSAFAAQSTATGAVTIMVINKVLNGSTPTTINIRYFTKAGSAAVYQLTAGNAITRLPNQSWQGSLMNVTLPPQSITLFVLPQ